MSWCWYIEGGGGFVDGFASRQEAIDAAIADECPHALVGTTSDPMDAIVGMLSAKDLADHIGEEIDVEDCYLNVGPDAQAALEAWAREHLSCDMRSVCLDGVGISWLMRQPGGGL